MRPWWVRAAPPAADGPSPSSRLDARRRCDVISSRMNAAHHHAPAPKPRGVIRQDNFVAHPPPYPPSQEGGRGDRGLPPKPSLAQNSRMAPASRSRWAGVAGAAVLAVIVVASLIPAKWQLRTGLPWGAPLAGRACTRLFQRQCFALPRLATALADRLKSGPCLGAVGAHAGTLPWTCPDLSSALIGAGSAIAAALAIAVWGRFRHPLPLARGP